MHPSASDSADEDTTNVFLLHADYMVRDAQFIVDSLPNLEIFSVERALRLLHAIHLVLVNFDDDWLTQEEIEQLIQSVLNISQPLQIFYDTPPPPRNIGTSTISTTSPLGRRPKYDIDLSKALRLHSLGNSWQAISEAMGVARQTMYYHLNQAGLSMAQKPFTIIDDDDLDEHISAISLLHPFAGTAIIAGPPGGDGYLFAGAKNTGELEVSGCFSTVRASLSPLLRVILKYQQVEKCH